MKKETILLIELQLVLLLLVFLVWKMFDLEEKVRRTNMFVHEAIMDSRFEAIQEVNVDDIVLGDMSAAGTMIMYSSFNCDHCSNFFEETFPAIDSAFIQTGKIKMVVRYLPETNDTASFIPIRTAYCMDQEDSYPAFMQGWAKERNDKTSPDLAKKILTTMGRDTSGLSACLSSDKHDPFFKTNAQKAREAGVAGSPFFIINGKELRGDRKFTKFKALIDQE